MLKLGDVVKIIRFPVGRDIGVISEIKPDVPYPYYLTSGKEDNDMGPYSADELVLVPKKKEEEK